MPYTETCPAAQLVLVRRILVGAPASVLHALDQVMATDIDEHGLEETARLAGGALTHASDVTKEQDVETLFKLAREKMGGCVAAHVSQFFTLA
jgi:hypothetical protein